MDYKRMSQRKEGIAMSPSKLNHGEFPAGLSQPSLRALAGAGIVSLEQVAKLGEAKLLQMHGVGPKTIRQLREALEARGLSFSGQREGEVFDET
jgi:hypothetical protein